MPLMPGRVALVAIVLCAPLGAQWQVIDKTIARLPNGEPNLRAPAPRKADGKPDLTGIWFPEPSRAGNIASALKAGELPALPWAQKLFDERKTGELSALDPSANCLPQGVPRINSTPAPFKVIQEPNLIVLLYEQFGQFRQIFLADHLLPKDPNPQWYGYSQGKWDGDTLVVDSRGFNDKLWLDQAGHPATASLHVTERFQRRDLGHMDVTATIDDPGAYTKPWSYTQALTFMADTELIEYICNENNGAIPHLKGK